MDDKKPEIRRIALVAAAWCALLPALGLAIPLYVIRPFRPQAPASLALALAVRQAAPWISAVCAALAIGIAWWTWKRTSRRAPRIVSAACCAVAVAGACLAHVNVFEIMFHPYPDPVFAAWDSSKVSPGDMVLAVRVGNQDRAYPVRTMGYHHIVNDTVGGLPIAVTYCTLCHTGLVWDRSVDGKTLYFRLAGINNGNALLRDEQTGSIWQQSTGQAIFGPLKGTQLKLVPSDELTAALWHSEQPSGRILQADAPYASQYDPKDWEKHVEKTPVVVDTRGSGIPPHELMLGLSVTGRSKAYPVRSVLAARVIEDRIADIPVVLVTGPDHASIRAFQARVAGQPAKFTFLPPANDATGGGAFAMTDAETGSRWNFQGCALDGPYAGECLQKIDANKDYWFDWSHHRPTTDVFRG
jgi:hypothetical protein